MSGDGVTIVSDRVPLLLRAVESLTQTDVLVGVPGTAAARRGGGPSNAMIAFWQDFGTSRIPAREFLMAGLAADMDGIKAALTRGATSVLGDLDNKDLGTQALTAVGLRAQNAVRRYINAGVAPPLAASTLRARMAAKGRPRKGARAELARRATGAGAGTDLAKPLVWTGQLRSSITFVLRKR